MGLCLPGSRINATALIRGMFHQVSNKPQPGSGVLPVAWLEEARFLSAAVRKITAGPALQGGSLSYGEPMGDAGLRGALEMLRQIRIGQRRQDLETLER